MNRFTLMEAPANRNPKNENKKCCQLSHFFTRYKGSIFCSPLATASNLV